MSKLESILLKKFKGASNEVQIDFEKGKNLTVIFGENGTGKSAIADAFDFICNNSIGSLEDKSIGSHGGKYIPTINSDSTDCKVCLKYDSKEWTSTLASRFIPNTTGPDTKPIVKILRREKIQNFIIKPPKDRYGEIKNFIETSKCDKLEYLVNQLRINKERDYNEATRALDQARESLEKLWVSENKPGKDYSEWANKELKEDKKSLENAKKLYQGVLIPLTNSDSANTSLNNSETDLIDIIKEFKIKEENFKKVSSEITGSSSDLINILKSAKKYVEKEKTITQCPVCEQSVISSDLIIKINDRLQKLDIIIKAYEELENFKKKVEFQDAQIKKAKIKFIESCINTAILYKDSIVSEITSLNIDWKKNSELLISENKNNLEFLDSSKEFYKSIISIKGTIEDKIEDITKKINSLNAIKTQVDIINEKTETASNLELLNENVKELNNLIIESRNEFVEGVLNSISADIDSMYGKIHPGEKLGGIKLLTDASKKASLDLKAKFQTQDDILPQAYYSESHLDTLGICLFIALSKLYKNDNTILVLDDVITSADQVHLSRFIQMLEEEIKNFSHTIITTHYQVWRDKYRFTGGNAQIIELLGWSIERGLRHTKTKLYVDELKEFRNAEPMDKQIVASKTGIFLEFLLDNLSMLYRCRIVRKPNNDYTLGDFLNCFNKDLKKLMKVVILNDDGNPENEIELKDIMTVLPENSDIRNKVGCHFSEVGANFTNDDIKLMVDNTISLADALICVKCGELPLRNRTGSYYECKCKKKRLYPLIEPT